MRKAIARLAVLILGALVCLVVLMYLVSEGHLGTRQGPGEITDKAIADAAVSERQDIRRRAAASLKAENGKQILFGDLHVHTTFSMDAFVMSLPVSLGEGAHPPADACDYARFCSSLDFWALTDHAESITPRHWLEIKDSIRQCNAVTDPDNPDIVAFLGFEWTKQESFKPLEHYGHKNVIYRDTEESKVPARPIYADCEIGMEFVNPPLFQRVFLPAYDFANRQIYLDHNRFAKNLLSLEECPAGVHTRDLPVDCREGAADPSVLFAKLDEGGYESIVIPHGNTWGNYTPAGNTWDKQLQGKMQDPKRQFLFEIFSGHGSAEDYRDWRAVRFNAAGESVCPEASTDYLPTCRRAGQIIKQRCLDAGESQAECRKRELQTHRYFLNTFFGMSTVSATRMEDWLDSGQCRDCFLPAFDYRPGGSAQYALAIANFDEPDQIRRFRFGFIGSSDNHSARPGTGFKERDRYLNSEARGVRAQELADVLALSPDPLPYATLVDPADRDKRLAFKHAERIASFFLTGGLIATHSLGRDRDSIWKSLKRKEVYATSGDRILLWFDLVNGSVRKGASANVPMGGETRMNGVPRFKATAVGAFKQKPGCPAYSVNALTPERLNRLCRNECYNPSDERRLITRIEVVRIRPQIRRNEDVKDLVKDVWLSTTCPPDPNGCVFEFEDPEFKAAARDTVYYVRAIQEPSLAVNADLVRCEYDAEGNCIKANPCHGSFRTPYEDDCLAKTEERAWSSPIFVDYATDDNRQ
ncbi:MAG: DUF3604 domain-containing protein [Proteobacteria bacterium]|nr:DUF3604 domain-containing protein [Pseudomonadota bacterium]